MNISSTKPELRENLESYLEKYSMLIRGEYTDVFSLLGIHQDSEQGFRINVMLPAAEQVHVLSATGKTVLLRLNKIHENGLFSGLLLRKQKPKLYRLKILYPNSSVVIIDPYQFPSLLSKEDADLFSAGCLEQGWKLLGANHQQCKGVKGINFAVWAPNARKVSVVGDFNHWNPASHMMRLHPDYGIWDLFIPELEAGHFYKYEITGSNGDVLPHKADPYARQMQLRPDTASVIPADSKFQWSDSSWMEKRKKVSHHQQAVSIYEVHMGSWKRNSEAGNSYLTYREFAEQLLPYVKSMGYTHIQFMPLSEYPFDGSWGYQPLGMYAPTSRYGSADDLRYFIDSAHRENIGVLIDWVPGHFPEDKHGLGMFDGTHLYEHSDPRRGFHPDWTTLIYNYGRAEVVSFLLSNVFYWLDQFHVDGLRFDAVASMLYLDYSRKDGEWLPNQHGGRENIEAIELLKNINQRAYFNYPGVMMIAEESTAWPGVTDFTERGGLGFGFKWNLGWMNDTLSYISRDSVHRKFHHNEMTFSLLYGFSENFILPLSHDEVVHGKRSIIGRMPGDDWQKFATLRAYYGFMWMHPGKKLLFMGNEFAQRDEWNHEKSLDWHLLDYAPHSGVQALVKALNNLYIRSPSLYLCDCDSDGFEWIDADNHANSVFAFLRTAPDLDEISIVVINLTPSMHDHVRLGVPVSGFYHEVLNTNATEYGGTGHGNMGGVSSEVTGSHGRPFSLDIMLPPLATIVFKVNQANKQQKTENE